MLDSGRSVTTTGSLVILVLGQTGGTDGVGARRPLTRFS